MIRKPSFKLTSGVLRTKIKGKAPTKRVMPPLITKGVKAESTPSKTDMPAEITINKALTKSALPT